MSVVVNASDVRYVRAEDETGSFGILAGHADFITVLAVSVITWRSHKDDEHYVAVRGGVLTVRDGDLVEVATREAVVEDTPISDTIRTEWSTGLSFLMAEMMPIGIAMMATTMSVMVIR